MTNYSDLHDAVVAQGGYTLDDAADAIRVRPYIVAVAGDAAIPDLIGYLVWNNKNERRCR